MRKLGILPLIMLAALAACENYDLDMHDQITFKAQEAPRFVRPPKSVTVRAPRVSYADVDGVTLVSPIKRGDEKTLAQGQKLYNIYCMPCHGADGTTKGAPVADKLEPRPADLQSEAVVALTEGEIFHRIVEGFGIMPSYKRDLTDEEAWSVTEYITAKLQKRE